ncbi:wings apart-like protein 2 [Andrographis paniculata]|uniref:wings apart-like protein 2 n=1 Tax=Andrographis paniculata TaxID=175694 RepID=UPI0021E94B6C|nr:wings apart-like protein 2 [Andrographis paniculata]
MMFRTYGRRGRGLERSYSGGNSFGDGGSDYSSQECPQDVYDFGFPSQDSTQCHWADPYSFDSSEESKQLEFLPSRKGEGRGAGAGAGSGSTKMKKAKKVEFNSEPFGASSSQELKELEVLEISGGDFQKSKKLKKENFDPFEYNSSEDDLMVLPQGKSTGNKAFEFSKHENLCKSKKSKNSDSDLYVLNSSQEWTDLGNRPLSKSKDNKDCREVKKGLGKSKKKDMAENGVLPKRKKKKKVMKPKEPEPSYVELTTTLMETQEFGEMMEHEDEVNFALDGLKKGQPVKIRRASLLSLLSICGTMQQRRLLRVHGMAKTIIDAVLGLSLDDPPSNLAAAALFYILTSDGQDDHILYSANCIRFLIKLLKPVTSSVTKNKSLPIGSKLLGLCKNAGLLQESAKGTDSSSTEIMSKVREILVSCKEIKPRDDSDRSTNDPELNPKWISLLTMEKACSSNLSMEDTSGFSRKSGANFKEKLREFGGLDAVFEVARKCHHVIEEWLEKSSTFDLDSKDISGLESLVLLLKCLKIMENATFLSKDNQCHLLEMKGEIDGHLATRSFVKLVLGFIKILSGVFLLRSSLSSSTNEKTGSLSDGACHLRPFKSTPAATELSADPLSLKMRIDSSEAGSCSGMSQNSNHKALISSNDSLVEFGAEKRQQLLYSNSETMGDTQDPFAFDEDELEPSKWDLLYSGGVKNSFSQESRGTVSGYKDERVSGYKDESRLMLVESQQESNHIEDHLTQEVPCSSDVNDGVSSLLADCLLTAVKVLMNLTNDNPEGCRQIATHGGLEILASLIAGHFPSFGSSLSRFDDGMDDSLSSKSSPRFDQLSSITLTDQELDFLVSILGLLVNLVEKDGRNRSRLAAASVSVPNPEGSDSECQSDLISLLCSIFLANQGSGEAAEEEKTFSLEDEESLLQGQKEAEKMIVEAYAALLLAFLSTESKSIRNSIAECLPEHNLKILVPVIERFVEFHMTLNVISAETHSAVLEVIESCRMP